MNKWLFLTGLTIFCLSKSFSQASNKYDIEINKELWKTDPIDADEYFDNKYLNDGNLYIHFQSMFENDTAEIAINGKFYGRYLLTTEWSSELAYILVVPEFEN